MNWHELQDQFWDRLTAALYSNAEMQLDWHIWYKLLDELRDRLSDDLCVQLAFHLRKEFE